ncbi:SH3-like domain-containing protein [Paenibacillus qinlingensis]|uniref:SH3-like domain-containing protein n=1 Tax=Paenibacillus qinlingensis TaxID=1837343 RepID=A0ABU1NQY1_9BACL|nr:SH3-like domain-containing protein [Paenibacillus qinlingensis]MDR6549888.1 SH3-like domain-containing protein [Paenibacillus qinlingensis]
MANWTVYGGSQVPEGLRIPDTIELLKDTPYYANPDDPQDKAEGVFAPQSVHVLKGEATWSVSSGSQWQIETMYGPRWVRPLMWDISISQPDSILLTEVTQLYRSQNDKAASVASLSPQLVEVVDMEDKWFVGDSRSGKAWVQIHTTWLGDLWAHMPINRISTVHPKSQRTHYNDEPYYPEVGTALQDNDHNAGVSHLAVGKLMNGDYEIISELTTVYDRSFLVRTPEGDRWVRGTGSFITDTNEKLELKVETPLLSDVWSTENQELGVLKGVTVSAFETIQDPFNGTWYHVRTSDGTIGWVNKRRAEPEQAVPIQWKMKLSGVKSPFRYPGVNFAEEKPNLTPQTVTAIAYWDEPSGNKWIKIHTADGDVWITISPDDRIQDPEATLQITYNERNLGYVMIIPKGEDLTLFGQNKIGYHSEKGTDYLSVIQLAKALRYESKSDTITHSLSISKGDYTFVLQAGQSEVQIYWHHVFEKKVQLKEPPQDSDREWYLNLEDLRNLFGLSQESSRNPEYYSLIEKDYEVELANFPAVSTDKKIELQAWLYEAWSLPINNMRLPAMLTIEEADDDSADRSIARQERIGTEAQVAMVWYQLHASRTLLPGFHQLNAVLRVGERIVWKQTFSVDVPS